MLTNQSCWYQDWQHRRCRVRGYDVHGGLDANASEGRKGSAGFKGWNWYGLTGARAIT